jgi:hypothetical protein
MLFLMNARANRIDAREMADAFRRANPVCPGFPIVRLLTRYPGGRLDRLVMVRREGQQICGAARWFCASSEVTVVLTGKRLGCI